MNGDWQHIGPHRYRLDGDVVCWEPHGEMSLAHAEALVDLGVRAWRQFGVMLLLSNATDLAAPSAEVRRLYADAMRQYRPRAVFGVFGAPFLTRVAQTMFVRTVIRITGVDVRFTHVETEAEARRFIDQERRRLRGEAG